MQNKRRGRIPQSAWPDILKRHNDGETLSSIARDFDCTPSAISYVLKKAANGDAVDFDVDDIHETADAPLLEQPETHHQPDAATAEPAPQTQPAQSVNAPESSSPRRDEWRDERRPTMRLTSVGERQQGGERSEGGQRTQNLREPRSDQPAREQAPREQGMREPNQREQWQPREQTRDINRDLSNEGRPTRNFDNRGDRPRRDESQGRDDNRRDDSRRDEQRSRGSLNQNAPAEPRLPPQIQAGQPTPTAGSVAPAPMTSEYRPSPPFRAVVAEETSDAPVVDVDTRIDTGAAELRAAYAAWRKTPSPEALDALQTAVHETRKVLARIEIDIAAARGNDAAPRANFRHTYRAAHR